MLPAENFLFHAVYGHLLTFYHCFKVVGGGTNANIATD
jgi:hypothetical protein